METKAYFINLPVSPKKARFYLPAIKKLRPVKSLEYLMYESTDAAAILYKAIKSAISSAKQILKVDENLLDFKLLSVEQGQKLKRYRPGSRGNAKPINRRMSHIKIIIEAKVEKKSEPKVEVKVDKTKVKNVKTQITKVKSKSNVK
jgi:large subunit ribosomal protein L22